MYKKAEVAQINDKLWFNQRQQNYQHKNILLCK